MHDQHLDFSADLQGIDRQQLLQEAASQIDGSKAHLSGSESTPRPTPEGDLLRDLVQDQASLASNPDVFLIEDNAFLDRQRPVPVRFKELAEQYKFYWVRIPVGLMPRRNWAYDRLEVKMVFNPGGAPAAKPRAYQILPDKRFQELLKVSDHLEVSLDEHFELSAKAGGNVGLAQAEASAKAKGGAGFELAAGPFNYRCVKAKIDHSGTGVDWVFWRLDGAEFFQENRPDLVVVAQVPKSATEFRIDAALQAYRFFNFAAAGLQDAIKHLGGTLMSFFKAGAPVADYKQYVLTDRL